MKVEQSLNVAFNESPPPTKLSLLVDDDVGEEEAIRKNTKIVNTNNEEDESIEVDEIINIKESKNHPLDRVIGNLNQRTLRSQAQNHKPGRGSSVPIDLFTAFALTQPAKGSDKGARGLWLWQGGDGWYLAGLASMSICTNLCLVVLWIISGPGGEHLQLLPSRQVGSALSTKKCLEGGCHNTGMELLWCRENSTSGPAFDAAVQRAVDALLLGLTT
ncbi:hypothetical protein Tco_0837195 [Tanacetum coccineum]